MADQARKTENNYSVYQCLGDKILLEEDLKQTHDDSPSRHLNLHEMKSKEPNSKYAKGITFMVEEAKTRSGLNLTKLATQPNPAQPLIIPKYIPYAICLTKMGLLIVRDFNWSFCFILCMISSIK